MKSGQIKGSEPNLNGNSGISLLRGVIRQYMTRFWVKWLQMLIMFNTWIKCWGTSCPLCLWMTLSFSVRDVTVANGMTEQNSTVRQLDIDLELRRCVAARVSACEWWRYWRSRNCYPLLFRTAQKVICSAVGVSTTRIDHRKSFM